MRALLAVLLLLAPTGAAGAPSAREIAERSELAGRLADVTAEATLTTGGPGAEPAVKRFTWWRKTSADGGRNRTLARFHAPAQIRGEGVLLVEHDRDRSEVLLYLPAYKKVRRVETQSQRSSFMGSAFSYADLGAPHAADYTHRLLREEPCPGSPRVACHVLELEPASEAVRERTGYARGTHWIRADNHVAVRAELVGLDGAVAKRLSASELREVDPAAGRWMPLVIRMEDARTGRFAELRFADVKANRGLADDLFTRQSLAREP